MEKQIFGIPSKASKLVRPFLDSNESSCPGGLTHWGLALSWMCSPYVAAFVPTLFCPLYQFWWVTLLFWKGSIHDWRLLIRLCSLRWEINMSFPPDVKLGGLTECYAISFEDSYSTIGVIHLHMR
ncbi:hypothetical protein M513_04597 [Trichuris suis]|uniref:Uncharacterized protein n=1 Tax=Trichuris suis TaxID=68888 RepID=A0A085MB54_9BILA|nr:hypothetical protein M513_04597 [Trichuris suis]